MRGESKSSGHKSKASLARRDGETSFSSGDLPLGWGGMSSSLPSSAVVAYLGVKPHILLFVQFCNSC